MSHEANGTGPNHCLMQSPSDCHGTGLVTTRSFERGSLLLVDPPVIYSRYKSDGWEAEIVDQFRSLSPEMQQLVLGLKYRPRCLGTHYKSKYLATMLPQLQVKTLYLLEIFGTNHKPMANRYNQDDSDSCQSGVFLNVYKINHACTPNAILSYFPEARVMRIYAVKALSKGEEVFIPYCDVSKTYVTRRRLLKFDCQCSTCKSPNRDDSDLRRQIISASRKQLLRDDHKLQTLPRHHDIDDIAWFRTKAYDHLKRVRDENLYHSYYEAYAFVAFFELHSRNGEASMEYIQLVQREDELCNGGIGSKPLEYLINTWYEKYGTINMASLTQGSRIC